MAVLLYEQVTADREAARRRMLDAREQVEQSIGRLRPGEFRPMENCLAVLSELQAEASAKAKKQSNDFEHRRWNRGILVLRELDGQ